MGGIEGTIKLLGRRFADEYKDNLSDHKYKEVYPGYIYTWI
jgi:hypothetical protein